MIDKFFYKLLIELRFICKNGVGHDGLFVVKPNKHSYSGILMLFCHDKIGANKVCYKVKPAVLLRC